MMNSTVTVNSHHLSEEIHYLNRNGWYVTNGRVHNKTEWMILYVVQVGDKIKRKAKDQEEIIHKLQNEIFKRMFQRNA